MLYRFSQNNSGGHTIIDNIIADVMIIEADSKDDAFIKGEELGLYFDGVEKGKDCGCCGDRWSRYPDEIAFPYEYSEDIIVNNIDEYCNKIVVNGYWKRLTRIFLLDGTIKEFNNLKSK